MYGLVPVRRQAITPLTADSQLIKPCVDTFSEIWAKMQWRLSNIMWSAKCGQFCSLNKMADILQTTFPNLDSPNDKEGASNSHVQPVFPFRCVAFFTCHVNPYQQCHTQPRDHVHHAGKPTARRHATQLRRVGWSKDVLLKYTCIAYTEWSNLGHDITYQSTPSN